MLEEKRAGWSGKK